jgi:hypothetical protein
MRFNFLPVCILSLFAALSPSSSRALNPNYDFKIVSISSQTIGGSAPFDLGGPWLNDRGEILILGQFGGFPQDTGQVLYTPDRELFRTGETIDGITIAQASQPALNDRGEVVFLGAWNPTPLIGEEAFFDLKSKRKLVQSQDTIDGLTLFGLQSPSLNDRGKLVFLAGYFEKDGSSDSGLFTPDHVVAKAGTVIDGYTLASVSSGVVDLSGTVFFTSSVDPAPTAPSYLFTQHHLLVKPGDVIGGVSVPGTISLVSASTLGNVTFLAVNAAFPPTNGLPQELFALRPCLNERALHASLIAKPGDTIGRLTIANLSSPASINNLGDIAFVADTSASNPFETQIFVDRIERGRLEFDPHRAEPIVALAGTGDSIDGQTLAVVNAPVMNDSGVIGFSANLANGQTAIVVATPKPPIHW